MSRAAVELVAESIPHLLFFARPGGEVDFVNSRFVEYTGKSREELLAWGAAKLIHPDDLDEAQRRWFEGTARRAPYQSRFRLQGADGSYRWFIVLATPVLEADGDVAFWLGTYTDIHEQVQLENQLRFLNEAGVALASSLESPFILQRIAQLGVEALADLCVIHERGEDEDIHASAVWHRDESLRESAASVIENFAPKPGGPLDQVLRTGHPMLFTDMSTALIRENATSDEHFALLSGFGFRSAMVVPLIARGRILGTISFVSTQDGRRFTERDLEFAQTIAQRASIAIENAKAFERQHRVAMALQRSLLPEFLPSVPGLVFSSTYRPAATDALVGGDWYDAFLLADGSVAVSLGDVAGHGLEAAALMGRMRELFRATAVEETRPSEMLRRVNRALLLDGSGVMVTAIFGIFDCWQESFTCAIAGHPPPMLVREGAVEDLRLPSNVPLGIAPDFHFESRTTGLKRGDLLALYTDGLIENRRDALEGTALLGRALVDVAAQNTHGTPAESVVDGLLNQGQRDDVALLIARFQGTPLSSFSRDYPAVSASAPHARYDVRNFLRSINTAGPTFDDLVLAVGEAVNNAIEHAFAGKDGEFTVRGQLYSDRVLFEIEDNGKWRITPAPEPVPTQDQARGRGLHLIRQIVERASIERTPLGTRVTLEQTL